MQNQPAAKSILIMRNLAEAAAGYRVHHIKTRMS